jgi:hypothetical protein
MSDDNNNSDPFDFEFNSLDEANPPEKSEDSFDLGEPFGDDEATSTFELGEIAESASLGADFGDSIAADAPVESVQSDEAAHEDEAAPAEAEKTKKGFWGSKGKAKKDNVPKEKKEKAVKEKKEKKPLKERLPLDWGATALCVAFTVFLLVSLLAFNIAVFYSHSPDSPIMQTLCFLGAFNIVGLVLAAVPVLFYKFPKERTLPNVLLGISAAALFSGVLVLVTEFYSYSFILKP